MKFSRHSQRGRQRRREGRLEPERDLEAQRHSEQDHRQRQQLVTVLCIVCIMAINRLGTRPRK